MSYFELPQNLYRLGTVFYERGDGFNVEVDRVQDNELIYILNSAVRPTSLMPIYVENHDGSGAKIVIYPDDNNAKNNTSINYVRKPTQPNWTYVVVNEQALYNSSASDHQDFELHMSEENNLVNKKIVVKKFFNILEYALKFQKQKFILFLIIKK